MATIDEIKKTRLEKLKAIESAGILAYPGETKRTHTSKEALYNFAELSKGRKEIFLAGRMTSLRQHGGLIFCHIEDGEGKIQIMLKRDGIGEKSFQFFIDIFDVGDFVQARGVMFETKKGEKTLEVSDYKILVKSLLPLPEKWHGIQDVEERFRKRYLDLIFNKEIKEKFVLRTKIIKEIRNFLDKEGFMEVETPILQPIYGGATAKPFKTHLNALDMDLYLRISPELYLKRLLAGGFEKVYDLGKCFRNEGIDKSHNPDFTMLEFYWAYKDYKELMKFTEKMLSTVLKKLFKSSKISYQGTVLDFKTPWPRIEYNELFKKETEINLEEMNSETLRKKAEEMGLKDVKGGKFEIADEIFKKAIRPKLIQPVFVIHYPAEAFPLAKPLDKNPSKSASFQLIAMGMELVKAYNELNNPVLQKENFEKQEKILREGFEEAQRMDHDFIEALEYGMPPAAGWGMGIDRLCILLTDSHSLRDIILFPTMRSR